MYSRVHPAYDFHMMGMVFIWCWHHCITACNKACPSFPASSKLFNFFCFPLYLFCSFNPTTCQNLCNINKAKYVQEKHGKRQSKYLHIKYNPCHILEIKNIYDYMVVHLLVRVEYRKYLVPGNCRWQCVTETHPNEWKVEQHWSCDRPSKLVVDFEFVFSGQ